MKIDLRYPFLTTGIPKRNTRRRDLYMAISMTVDIPDISARETEVAFKTARKCRINFEQNAYVNGEYKPAWHHVVEHTGGTVLRTFGGKLYRRIGTERDIVADPRERIFFNLGRAFPHGIGGLDLEYGANISFAETGSSNAMSAALIRQWDWELERTSISDGRVVNAWPMALGGLTRHGSRENLDFRGAMADIRDIDAEASDRSLAMIGHQARRLLAIDGEVWMACRPPALVVDVDENQPLATLSLAHAHDGFDAKLSRRYFALNDLEAAREYLRDCVAKRPRERCEYQALEALPSYELLVPEIAEYDAEGEELSRIGYALASECARFIARTDEWIEGNKRDSLDAAMQAVSETNYALGVFGDVTPFVDDLCGAWDYLGRPTTFCHVGPAPARKRFGDMLIKRALKLGDNAVIDLGSRPGFQIGVGPRL
ncbi:hypothetical protein [Rhizobium sp. BK176]|uniref:hypothetical protein n=1 Tax=Rhizobium sp. BK176 TaxID=2587071 RepID=UPI002166D2A0|nr:hypothetical protein [Rhizobium sp. BK176]MCS4089345.1 hypothetical protein [Rhizobium sp. BK176]